MLHNEHLSANPVRSVLCYGIDPRCFRAEQSFNLAQVVLGRTVDADLNGHLKSDDFNVHTETSKKAAIKGSDRCRLQNENFDPIKCLCHSPNNLSVTRLI